MICVLVLGAGEDWEKTVLSVLEPEREITVLRRCMDVADLLAAASTDQAQAAVVDLATPGFDLSAVQELRGHGVLCVAVADAPRHDDVQARAQRLGISQVIGSSELSGLPTMLGGLPVQQPFVPVTVGLTPTSRRILTVWGPHGAPGRTTVAVALAAEWARRSRPVTLVDADPCAASISQSLGLLEESSGLLAAVRTVQNGGQAHDLLRHLRRLTPHLDVLTGLPRPDRWNEVRLEAMAQVLDLARQRTDLVLDTGACAEEGPPSRPSRHGMTRQALEVADDVVVVGLADPVGLTRLVQALADLSDLAPTARRHVVLNRMRPTLGWSAAQVREMLAPFVGSTLVHALPEDRTAADRALSSGRSVVENRRGPLAAALSRLADTLEGPKLPLAHLPEGDAPATRAPRIRGRLRRRTGSTARPR